DELLYGARETGGQFVFFEVQDSGIGISEENIKHIFDPFFTSRENGRGLGLAVVFGFVKSHDGLIRAKTTCGEGTCFRILLPASSSVPTFNFDDKPTEHFAPALVDHMTILVVDDEPAVRNTAKALLESIGWNVHVARSGAQALQVLDQATFNIDCVLLDVVMPNMGAKEVLEQLRLQKKNVCVVLMSGNSSEQLDPYRKSKEVSAVLAKPFKTQELVEAISAAVESHNDRPSTAI
ncbi:response regulator, partial [bacterium]|nr:response regulator [bacterium]